MATTIEVRQSNGQCEYGPWLRVDDISVPGWVGEWIADERAELLSAGDHEGARCGAVEWAGSRWVYRVTSDLQHDSQVVTWGTPSGATLNICLSCEAALRGRWPKDHTGTDYCQVSHGLHRGTCEVNDAMLEGE